MNDFTRGIPRNHKWFSKCWQEVLAGLTIKICHEHNRNSTRPHTNEGGCKPPVPFLSFSV